MTPAQKKNQDTFKKAIAYRKKTGCTLKQAFAYAKGGKVAGLEKVVKKGSKTSVIYSKKVKKKAAKKKAVPKQGVLFGVKKKAAKKKATSYHKDTASHNVKISVVSGFFDTTAIKDLDALKKQYFSLAKKYHPDAGGTTVQFQELQAEYDKLLKKILSGSGLSEEQKENEKEIDKAIRDIIDSIINLPGITIELVGKWLWIGGDTYPVRTILKSAGLVYIKKAGVSYWVYKGVESKSRGKMDINEIKAKYGVHEFKAPAKKLISGVPKFNKTKLKSALLRLKKGLNKRPV
jgi:hypothetical protein